MLTEEVADTAIGLILCTVREFPQAERFLRAGKWVERGYPLTKATMRDRTVGVVGMGAIGQAIARRLDAMKVPVVYHSRRPAAGVGYRHYPKLLDMARDVDILVVITPGGPETKNLINVDGLKALGPDGILINMARGSVVDEPALIQALKDKTILSAGLDVFVGEPEVPAELIAIGERRAVSLISARRRSIRARRWTTSWSTISTPGPPARGTAHAGAGDAMATPPLRMTRRAARASFGCWVK